MSRTKRSPDTTSAAGLTVGQLRALLIQAVDDASPSYGMEADAAVLNVETELREIRELVESIRDDLDGVMTRMGLDPAASDDGPGIP